MYNLTPPSLFVSASVSVPSVTAAAAACWVRGSCKCSAPRLSLTLSSATRAEEVQRATAVTMTKPLSQMWPERPPQDRGARRSKWACLTLLSQSVWPSVLVRTVKSSVMGPCSWLMSCMKSEHCTWPRFDVITLSWPGSPYRLVSCLAK